MPYEQSPYETSPSDGSTGAASYMAAPGWTRLFLYVVHRGRGLTCWARFLLTRMLTGLRSTWVIVPWVQSLDASRPVVASAPKWLLTGRSTKPRRTSHVTRLSWKLTVTGRGYHLPRSACPRHLSTARWSRAKQACHCEPVASGVSVSESSGSESVSTLCMSGSKLESFSPQPASTLGFFPVVPKYGKVWQPPRRTFPTRRRPPPGILACREATKRRWAWTGRWVDGVLHEDNPSFAL